MESPLVRKAVQQARSHAPATLRRINAGKSIAVGTQYEAGRVNASKRRPSDLTNAVSDDELNLGSSPVHNRSKKVQHSKRADPSQEQATLTWSSGETEAIAAASTSASPVLPQMASSRQRSMATVVEVDVGAFRPLKAPFETTRMLQPVSQTPLKRKAMSPRKRMYPTPESPERIESVMPTAQTSRTLHRRAQGSPSSLIRQTDRAEPMRWSRESGQRHGHDQIVIKKEESDLGIICASQSRQISYDEQQDAGDHVDAIVNFVSGWSAEPWPPDQVAFIAATLGSLGLVDTSSVRSLAKADALAQDRFFNEAKKAGIHVLWEVLMRSALDKLIQ